MPLVLERLAAAGRWGLWPGVVGSQCTVHWIFSLLVVLIISVLIHHNPVLVVPFAPDYRLAKSLVYAVIRIVENQN